MLVLFHMLACVFIYYSTPPYTRKIRQIVRETVEALDSIKTDGETM